jgi:hypothetical protein
METEICLVQTTVNSTQKLLASPVSHRLVTKTICNPNLVKSRCINYVDRKILKNYRISNEVLKSTSG